MTDEMESMEQPHSTVQVRPYTPTDHAAIVALAPRFLVGLAPWLDEATFLMVAQGWIASSIAGIGPDQAVFVAEQPPGQPVGFVSVARQIHFSGQPRAYVGELIVAAEAERTGLGRAPRGGGGMGHRARTPGDRTRHGRGERPRPWLLRPCRLQRRAHQAGEAVGGVVGRGS